MKKTLLLPLSIALAWALGTGAARAQQSFGGTPLTFGPQAALQSAQSVQTEPRYTYHVPLNFNVDDEIAASSWASAKQGQAPRVGRLIDCNLDFARDARLIANPQGVEIYRMIITTDGTPAGLNLYYTDFYIPQGGRLYIYNAAQDVLLGSYTTQTHPQHGSFATEPVSGSTLVLEYERPAGTPMPTLQIEALGYLFMPMLQARAIGEDIDASDPFIGKACQININCPEGDDWQVQKEGIVAYLSVLPIEGGGRYQSACSGNLMNNSNQDFIPYIITASHCAGEGTGTSATVGKWEGQFKVDQELMDQWIFGFGYERPGCSNGNLANHNVRTLTGCTMKSYIPLYAHSDGMLLQLNKQVPEDYRVYYNGYDATDVLPQSGAGIHHPAADSKKISLFDGGSSLWTWRGAGSQGAANDHYRITYDKGQTEGGSSGSSLFNQDKLVVGTLTGGDVRPCAGSNYYGRLSVHWDKYAYKGDQYQMGKYLDPAGNGRVLQGTWRNGFKPLLHLKQIQVVFDDAALTSARITWEDLPAHDQGYPIRYSVYRNGELIGTSDGREYVDRLTDELRAQGAVNYSVAAVYTTPKGSEETAPAYASLFVGNLNKEVTDLKVTDGEKGGAVITWKAPVNTQTIRKVALDHSDLAVSTISPLTGRYTRAWVGDYYRTEQLGLGNFFLSQVNFIPAQADKNYTIIAYQRGQKPAVMTVGVPADAPEGQMYSVTLPSPFMIDPNQALFIGYQLSPSKPYAMTLFNGTKDDAYEYDGAKVYGLYVDAQYSMDTEMLYDLTSSQTRFNRNGYLATEVVISDSAEPLAAPVTESFVKGKYAAPFPRIKGYNVYKDGTLLTFSPGTYVEDPQGATNNEYRVEVVYEDAPVSIDAPAQHTVYAYPARFTDHLRVNNAHLVSALRIVDLQGRTLLSTADASFVQTSALAPGTYLLVMETPQGRISQKVVKE